MKITPRGSFVSFLLSIPLRNSLIAFQFIFSVGALLSCCCFPIMDYSKERSANFLNFFWDLASDDDKSRAQASKAIIVYLCDSESEERQVDISYAIKRLIRGLPSSRQSARQGFASCLCQFLQEVKSVKLDEVITLLDENTKVCLLYLCYELFNNVLNCIDYWLDAWS